MRKPTPAPRDEGRPPGGGARRRGGRLFPPAYNVLLHLFFLVALPYYAAQMLRREKYRAGLRQRLGFYPASLRGGRGRIWIHAVSVGEVQAALPLVARLRRELPDRPVVVSTVTLTGRRVATERLGGSCAVVYFPLDLPFAVRRALRAVDPALVVLVETEIWPNFLLAARRRGIPVAIVNGRISDRSHRGYRRARRFLRGPLDAVRVFSMQTDLDARRVIAMGAPADRVTVAGNMKFDCPDAAADPAAAVRVARALGLPADAPVLVAGSTHPGEERILLDVLEAARRDRPDLVLVLVPRHPERAEEVAELARARGERCALRSGIPSGGEPPRYGVLVVDTVGELLDVYRCATVVFVGKSLTGGGGQNVIEPACLGRPVVFGPSMHNFREAAGILLRCGGAVQAADAAELAGAVRRLLADEGGREAMGRRAAEAMAGSRGATERNAAIIRGLLAAE
ncbi:MAG: 3-deoxy-D-manno-octulosonic acid transferase [bacterium]|nr:3-deoxy-D-manno-octulosonic acid transferase [bacterium]